MHGAFDYYSSTHSSFRIGGKLLLARDSQPLFKSHTMNLLGRCTDAKDEECEGLTEDVYQPGQGILPRACTRE